MTRNVVMILLVVGFVVGVNDPTQAKRGLEGGTERIADKSVRATQPVVVELFTSEGCSSCPPADRLLEKLRAERDGNEELILLGEHVDYWDGEAWRDRFSSREFSERQSAYGRQFRLESVYTPQIVVDGRVELVGNDEAGVRKAIATAARGEKPAQVKLTWAPQSALAVQVAGKGIEGASVMMAITEDGLTTKVGGGENGGRVLRHTGVVRKLEKIGTVKGGGFQKQVAVRLDKDWDPAKVRVVVWVQQGGGVVGAEEVRVQ